MPQLSLKSKTNTKEKLVGYLVYPQITQLHSAFIPHLILHAVLPTKDETLEFIPSVSLYI